MNPTCGRPARRLRPSLIALLLVLAAAGGTSTVARAAAPVQLAETGPFVDVAVTDVPGGGYLLVWQDASSLRLRAFRVSAEGFPGPFLSDLPEAPFGVFDLDATNSVTGGWIVLWTQPSGADQIGIGGAVFDAQDRLVRLLELPDPIPDPGGLVIAHSPHVTALPGGGYVLGYTLGVQDDPHGDPLIPSDTDVYALRLDDDGLQVGAAVRVNDDPAGFQTATAAGASEIGVVLTWSSWVREGDGQLDTRARVLGLDLSPASPPIQVNDTPILPQSGGGSGVAVASDGRFVVAWEAGEVPAILPPVGGPGAAPRGAAPQGTPPNVTLRAFDAAGDPVSGETVVGPPGSPHGLAGVALDGDGVAWVGWSVMAISGIPQDPSFAIRARPFDLLGEPLEPAHEVAVAGGAASDLTAGERGALVTWRPAPDSALVVGQVVGLPPEVGTPPPELALESPELPGFRVWVRIAHGDSAFIWGTEARPCLAEALCAAGALPDRAEAIVRVVGPKPNGFLWPTIVKLSTSRIEVWIEQLATGDVQYYLLPGAAPGSEVLPGLFDRHGFEP